MDEKVEQFAAEATELDANEEAEEDEDKEDKEPGFEGPWYLFPPIRNAAIGGVLTLVGYLLGRAGAPFAMQTALYLAAIGIGGYHWLREGWEELIKEREIGIEALMAGATLGAIALGQWVEAAFLVFLYGAAEGIEEYTFARTRSAIKALLDLTPKEAHLLNGQEERTVPATSLKPGDLILVRPGESLATDGVIRAGRSSINESALTGESMPVEKGTGNRIFAGTVNGAGALTVEVSVSFEDNTLSKIIRLVEKAQAQKGRAQRFIERFGRRYSPTVLLVALLMLALPPLFGLNWQFWATRAVVLLVAAAPCALIMSTPVAMAAAIGAAGRHGVLIKGGAHLENLGAIQAVAMDKTGTLTRGRPVVTTVMAEAGHSADEVLAMAAAVERSSEHPLAQAIISRAAEKGLEVPASRDFTALVSAGAQARVEDETFYVGSPELFYSFEVKPSAAIQSQIDGLRDEGHTVVLVGTEKQVAGLIAIRDQVRPEAKVALQDLRRADIRHLVMLTGDNERTARAIAGELGIEEVRAEMKPEDKSRVVEELVQKYRGVIMVGDGINDAPALAAATVGMAMGTAGTDAAIEAADVALMSDDLSKVAFAIRLGRRAKAISRQNIVFSLLVLAVLVPSALLGILGVSAAVVAHETSELLAVANGLRARQV